MQTLRVAWKLLGALVHVGRGWWLIRRHFPSLGPDERERVVEQWSRRMLAIMGIRLEVQGTPPARGPLLLVSNHLSWLDILAIHASRHVRFVSKADVHGWPVIGTLADGAGTLYIERERPRDSIRVVHHMAEALANGELVAVFPEGTTSDGTALLPFHANLLQAAISTGAPVQPMALCFLDDATGRASEAPRYAGDDRLVTSLWSTLSARRLRAVVRFGEPQPASGRRRREWARALHAQVDTLKREISA
jgi:1-acyl-sn-glycerol-3-phosphate acyltransferase